MSLHHLKLDNQRWQLLRLQIFERDNWRCRNCGKAGRLECDHIVPLRQGGAEYDPANLQAICRGCHIEKTRAENRRERTAAERAWDAMVTDIVGQSDKLSEI